MEPSLIRSAEAAQTPMCTAANFTPIPDATSRSGQSCCDGNFMALFLLGQLLQPGLVKDHVQQQALGALLAVTDVLHRLRLLEARNKLCGQVVEAPVMLIDAAGEPRC